MKVSHLHDWNISPKEAVALQKQLVGGVIFDQPIHQEDVHYVAGVDVSVKPGDDGRSWSQAAIVILTFPGLEIVEVARARMPTPFPYIPGLLSFREGAVLLEAFSRLEQVPDVCIFDGMGRAHPRRIGIATHIGLWLDRPTIGCGKTLLIGKYNEPPAERGAWSPMSDKGEIIGAALRTRATAKPVYISVGHRATLESAVSLVMACTGKYRLPEPIRAAHNAAGEKVD